MPTTRRMPSLRIGILLLFAAVSAACAQKPAASKSASEPATAQDSLATARDFVQEFLERYMSDALANMKLPAYWNVLSANKYLDGELANALRADSAARANYTRTESRELLD